MVEGRIRILHLITELYTGGAQMVLLRLLAHSDRQRFEHHVACLYGGDGAIGQRIAALGFPVSDLGMRARWRFDAFLRLYRLLHRMQPDILHTWMFHANLPGRVIGRMAGVPHIVSAEHTMRQERRWRRWLNRLSAPLAERVICVSQGVADYAREVIGLPAAKLVVIPNGVDLEEYQNLPMAGAARRALGLAREALWIGAVGRPRPVKGYTYLLQAFAHLANAYPQARLLLVGDGPELPSLQAQARAAGIWERVTFLGERGDIPTVLAALDLLAMPSLTEGMPVTALEAMAAGLPVVATDVGGTPEVVLDEVTGLLVPPAQPEALASAVARLLDDPGLRQRMGQAGRQHVENHFSLTQNVARTEALYAEMFQQAFTSGSPTKGEQA